jgi:predicted RNA binding protein YcfA (HicA-like mRNA interferase family)
VGDGFYRDVVSALKKAGFRQQGNFKGSHERWVTVESRLTVCVPFNLGSRFTANAILKDAGLTKRV